MAKVGVVSSVVFSFAVRFVLVTRWCCIMCLRKGRRAVSMIASQRMHVCNLCAACLWVRREKGLGSVLSQTEQVKRLVVANAEEGKLAMEEVEDDDERGWASMVAEWLAALWLARLAGGRKVGQVGQRKSPCCRSR